MKADEMRARVRDAGLLLRSRTEGTEIKSEPIPFTTNTIQIQSSTFDAVVDRSKIFCSLIAQISVRGQHIRACVASTVAHDTFMRDLLLCMSDRTGKVDLLITRSDFLMDDAHQEAWHIETNTIAASFGCISTRLCDLVGGLALPNDACELLISSLAEAHRAYLYTYGDNALESDAMVVILTHGEDERNAVDISILQTGLTNIDIPCFLLPLRASFTLDDENRLMYKGREISVCYFRTGYSPNQYDSLAWECRRTMEKSNAIQCPSIAGQLAGSKKIQQLLSSPSSLSTFLSASQIERVSPSLVPMWPYTAETKLMVKQAPREYILKPSREGGGNNIFAEDILNVEPTDAHVLMRRVFPTPFLNTLVSAHGANVDIPTLLELGVFASVLVQSDYVPSFEDANVRAGGYLARSKAESCDEGGVMAGASYIGCISLINP